jgi:hypothetical protein
MTDTAYVCPPDHKHQATGTCYNQHLCRCDACRKGRADAARARKRAQLYGRWTPPDVIDADIVRRRIEQLTEFGIGINRLGRIARFPMIQRVVYGYTDDHGCRVTMRTVAGPKARRLLAIRPTLDLIADGARIPARGTHRRLQALVAHGWSELELSRRLEVSTNEVNRILRADVVTGGTHRAVASLFDALWDVMPPTATPAERGNRVRSLNLAARKGWVPALAWDDIDLDDAPALAERGNDDVDETAVELALTGSDVTLTPAERRVAVRTLHGYGLADPEIAARLSCSDRTVLRIRDELELPAVDNPHTTPARQAA